MKQEDKDLLLIDLYARIPYGVKCHIEGENGAALPIGGYIITDDNTHAFNFIIDENIRLDFKILEEVKPYLFPLSNITEEQKKELFELCEFYIHKDWEGKKSEILGIEIASRPDPIYCYDNTFRIWNVDMRAINWFLKNHFDINNLISRELAINATGLNIYL